VERALAREAATLYELPADEFTKARNERAKALKQKEPELAAEVAKLPKPTAAAAAVNRLAHREPSEVRALIQAGKRLRDAQERAVRGRSGGEALPEAIREHRAALERVQREARRLKLSEPVLERALATFRAASIDPELQPLLEKGLLAREVEASGFALDPGLAVATPSPARKAQAAPKATQKQTPKPKPQARTAARKELKAARERLAEARRAASAAGRTLAQAQREAERADEAVQEAEAAVEAAQAKLRG
jgi:hypothetical protein